LRLVEEDPPEMITVRENFCLVRKVRTAAVYEIHARKAVLFSNLLGAEMLLHRHWIISAAFDRRVVADDHHVAAGDPPYSGNDTGSRNFAVIQVACRELSDLEKRGAWVEKALDAISRQELSARDVSFSMLLGPALRSLCFSASARLCAARVRNSSLSVAILL
jgi:hypothetical protein